MGRAAVSLTLGGKAGLERVEASVGNGGGGKASATAVFYATGILGRPTIFHYDGASWKIEFQAPDSAPVSLNAIWGTSPSMIIAVGSQCEASQWVQYNGTTWTVTDNPYNPCPGSWFDESVSVAGSSPSDIFVVRNNAYMFWNAGSISHFDGTSWTQMYPHGCPGSVYCGLAYINGIWSGSPTWATAVGDSGLIVQYDGTAWRAAASGTTRNLHGVWGIGSGPSSSIFAVGDSGTIAHFDGSTWQQQASGTTQPLYGIWGASASDVFAVGLGGIILHYDGTTWSQQQSGAYTELRAVWGTSGKSVFVVGSQSILHYDGSSWTMMPISTLPAPLHLRGVWGTSPTNVYAVGRAP
jgi:hypothetical protein